MMDVNTQGNGLGASTISWPELPQNLYLFAIIHGHTVKMLQAATSGQPRRQLYINFLTLYYTGVKKIMKLQLP